jgi:hypothetical protein
LIQEKAKNNYDENVGRPSIEKSGQISAPINKSKTRDEVAKIAGVSHDTLTESSGVWLQSPLTDTTIQL